MSGHSKWSTIKHKKAATDAKRAQIFTKLAREVTAAARAGGADPTMNATLRLAIQRARDANMPNDNIKRAIDRGAGGGDGADLLEIQYEAYGPAGTAILLQTVTDNRNRTVADVRALLSRNGGTLAENGAVAWQFDLRGVVTVRPPDGDQEAAELVAIEAGAIDITPGDETLDVLTEPGDFEAVRSALEEAGCAVEQAELAQVPQNTVELDAQQARQVIRLLELLEDLEDVSRVFSNADFTDEVLEAAGLAG